MACSPLTPNLLAAPPKPSMPARGASHRMASAARRPHRSRTGAMAMEEDDAASASASAATAMEKEKRRKKERKRCLRCGTLYLDEENSPVACAFHGHITGEKGLFSLSPPHQGIDGEWSDKSGVIVYRWNEQGSGTSKGAGPTPAAPTGKEGGAAAKSATRKRRRAAAGATSPTTMASLSSK